jgi:hypothetical protein
MNVQAPRPSQHLVSRSSWDEGVRLPTGGRSLTLLSSAKSRPRSSAGGRPSPTTLSCRVREFAEDATGAGERFDLVREDLLGRVLQLSVWADGSLWVSVCVRGKGRNAGWSFADSFNGSALDVAPATLVGMVVATGTLRLGSDPPAECEQLRLLWARVSPRPV